MCSALTRTFMYEEALVRRLPVPGTRADPYLLLIFSKKDSEITPVRGAVILFPNLIIVLHGLRYCTVLIAFQQRSRLSTACNAAIHSPRVPRYMSDCLQTAPSLETSRSSAGALSAVR